MYDFLKIEQKWQTYWDENNCFMAINDTTKKKYYILVEFPYPSGSGLHIGHPRSYTALDVVARKRRQEGYNVLFPIGWDAFGLPAENYALQNKIHPREAVQENIKVFKKQLKMLGFSFTWDREIATTDPEYIKWTQWQFLKFYEHGLAYKAKKLINWCTSCQVGLANEEVEGGKCERCGGEIVRKEKAQWVLKMRSYAEQLISGLEDTAFIDKVKTAQINWIGKSEGVEIEFALTNSNEKIKVYTTRPDTIYGATFMVLAPEHPLLETLKPLISNYAEIKAYQRETQLKSEFERVAVNKIKTGKQIKGVKVLNPLTKQPISLWVADYVMMGYGTGAVMGVPAHDDRDYAFAKKYNLPIIEVIKGGNIVMGPYIGNGEMINSGFLNGIKTQKEAIEKMINYIEEKELGKRHTEYRLQDWIFSRQRFWGEPIPMIYCEKCGWVPVPETDLPVLLPDIAYYEPTSDGESPLANIPEWYTTTCPKCGLTARRETDTMPNWAGSSWYWLRYMDPNNNKDFVSAKALDYWGKVDWYNGGMEHATRHLLYARFWHRFLYDIGLVPTPEPFIKRTAHGMVLGENNEKMSKSKGNVINPNEIVEAYGADALRVYEMFMGDYELETAWSYNGLKGCKRFLDRVWRLQTKVKPGQNYTPSLEVLINQTIKKVSTDIENMKFNTALSALMIMLNEYEKLETITKADFRLLLILLNPFAPHLTEELNVLLTLGEPLYKANWPCYDKTKIKASTFELVIQVNGKVRGRTTVLTNLEEAEIKAIALKHPNVEKFIQGQEIVKVIVVPQKLVNIVVK